MRFSWRIYLLLLALLSFGGCIKPERVAEIHTQRGYIIVIRADFHCDGICVPLDFILLDPNSRRVHSSTMIACWDSEDVVNIETTLDLYECDGGKIVALYDVSNPNWILGIIDFDSMLVYPSADTKRTKSYLGQRDGVLNQLRNELGNQDLVFLRE
jgi:hypothetical protein